MASGFFLLGYPQVQVDVEEHVWNLQIPMALLMMVLAKETEQECGNQEIFDFWDSSWVLRSSHL